MRRSLGFTIIELMISLTLGLLIAAAAIQLFLANQVSLNFQRGMNDVQVNGRFALDQLMHDIRLAGINSGVSTSGFASTTSPIIFSTSDYAGLPTSWGFTYDNDNGAPTTDAPGKLAKSDGIIVQYLSVQGGVDCEGHVVQANDMVVSRYFVGADAASNNVPALMCQGDSINASTNALRGNDTGAVALVDGVDSFQVLYGIDDGQNGTPQVAQYVTATQYKAMATPRPVILAVRVGMYMESPSRAGDATQSTQAVPVLDQSIPSSIIPNDGLMRRLFISTASLRNASPSGV